MTDIALLDLDKKYSYADYLKWQFKERLELIKGKIYKMSPAPRVNHQRLSGNVYASIHNFLANKKCEVFSAPFDVRLSKKNEQNEMVHTVVQPDICVICDTDKLDEYGCVGAPDIVVEILSPGNNTKELQLKYDIYEASGVKEYWVLDPDAKTFFAYILDEAGKYQPTHLRTIGDFITTPILPGFTLNLEEAFDY